MKVVDEDERYAIPPMHDGNSMQLTGPMSMRQLANSLMQYTGKPVLDGTNLEGYFLIDLTFAPDSLDGSIEGVIPPLLPKALEKQLGLKLVAAKEAVRILVVDHADAVPVEN